MNLFKKVLALHVAISLVFTTPNLCVLLPSLQVLKLIIQNLGSPFYLYCKLPLQNSQGNLNSKITTKVFQIFNATTYCVSLILDFIFLALPSPKNTLNYPKLQNKIKCDSQRINQYVQITSKFFLRTQEFKKQEKKTKL